VVAGVVSVRDLTKKRPSSAPARRYAAKARGESVIVGAVTQVGIHEAKTKFSQLVARAEAGEEIVITRYGQPVARLVRMARTNSFASVRGALRCRIHMADDFDELPDDIADAFGAR
jgi:prevent-host-death family protein